MSVRAVLGPFRPIWAAAVAVVGALFVGVGYVLTGKGVLEVGLPIWAWQIIAFFVMVAMIGVMFYHFAPRAVEKVKTTGKVTEQEPVAEGDAAVYAGRIELESAHPIQGQIERARTIDGIWLSGRVILQSSVDREVISQAVRRVILPSNKLAELQRLASLTSGSDEALGNDVLWATKRCLEWGIEVKWLERFPGFTALIGNIDSQDGWAIIEVLWPHTLANRRPVFRIPARRNEKAFQRLTAMFTQLWSEANPPPEGLFT